MITELSIEEVILDQKKYFSEKSRGILRDIDYDYYIKTNRIVVIMGVRRCVSQLCCTNWLIFSKIIIT